MPYEMRQISPRKWEVINTQTKEVHAKGTSKKNAEKQIRLLYGIESKKWKPTKNIDDNKKMVKQTWISFWAGKSKGKKFSSKDERHAFMKQALAEWHSKKQGKGAPLLLQPGLGATTGNKLWGL